MELDVPEQSATLPEYAPPCGTCVSSVCFGCHSDAGESMRQHQLGYVSHTLLVTLEAQSLLRLGTPLPMNHGQVDSMRQQIILVEDRLKILMQQDLLWADDELLWHLHQITAVWQQRHPGELAPTVIDPLLVHGWVKCGPGGIAQWFGSFRELSAQTWFITAVAVAKHWIPLILVQKGEHLHISTWDAPSVDHAPLLPVLRAISKGLGLVDIVVGRLQRIFVHQPCCGALAVGFLSHRLLASMLPELDGVAIAFHSLLRDRFIGHPRTHATCSKPWQWGYGTVEQAITGLIPVLCQNGAPEALAEARAKAAVRARGHASILTALAAKHPWRQLKILGNQVKFQYLLPSELESRIAATAAQLQTKSKGGRRAKRPANPEQPLSLDPTKLAIPDGVFQSSGRSLKKIALTSVGPAAQGVALKANQVVSTEPLALVLLHGPSQKWITSLPQTPVVFPCRCSANLEPLLVEATLVQLGKGLVEKTIEKTPMKVDTLDVSTIKLMVYRDESHGSWDGFVAAPLKYVLSQWPLLTLCDTANCQCPCWHNDEHVPTKQVLHDA